MRDFIERLRAHPEHIRHRIAMGTTVGFTGLVAIVWFGTLVTSGSLALNLAAPGTAPANATGNVHTAANETQSHLKQLLGAVGAIQSGSSTPALAPVGVSASPAVSSDSSADTSAQGSNLNDTNQRVISF